jgi:fucose permease
LDEGLVLEASYFVSMSGVGCAILPAAQARIRATASMRYLNFMAYSFGGSG